MSGYDRQEKEREDKYPALAAGYLTCAGDPGQGQGILGLGAGHVPGRLDVWLPGLGHVPGRLDVWLPGLGHVPGRLDAGLPEPRHMSGRLDAGAAGT